MDVGNGAAFIIPQKSEFIKQESTYQFLDL